MKKIKKPVSRQQNISYEGFRNKYYFKNAKYIKLLKDAFIEEFNETEDMKIEELLPALKEVMIRMEKRMKLIDMAGKVKLSFNTGMTRTRRQ